MSSNLITIKNNKGLEIKLSPVGAGIYSITLNGDLLTLTPKNESDYDNGYYGKTIAPVPNRLDKGLINIDDKKYIIDINEGPNSLHSGNKGICYKSFNYEIKEKEEVITVRFHLTTKEEKGTVPGTLSYEIMYVLYKEENTLLVEYKASSSENTYLSMTNHSYFTLGETNLNDIKLCIPSSSFIETRKEDLIPLKEVDMIECLDFNNMKNILKDVNHPYLKDHKSFGIDHAYRLNKNKIYLEGNKHKLEIKTDFEFLQIYSDNYEDGIEMIGVNDTYYRGVAIEPEDNILIRENILKDEIYNRYIIYKFY